MARAHAPHVAPATTTARPPTADRSHPHLPTRPDPATLLRLQRTAGNRAVQALLDPARPSVQRHPEHAEEQDVQRAVVQRHPEHAEEQDVQRAVVGGRRPQVVSRLSPTVQRVASSDEIIAKEKAMTATYGIQIGPPGWPVDSDDHLSLAVLGKVEAVLLLIPPEHLRGQSLRGGIGDGGGMGAASFYAPSDKRISIVTPPGLPAWLYPLLSKSWSWQLYLMDLGAKSGYAGLTKGEIADPRRQVMGGGSGGSLGGNLLEWTVRHELGHGVDEQIKFTQQRAKEEKFGGWKLHPNLNMAESGDMEVVRALLANAGFDYLDRGFLAKSRATPTLPQMIMDRLWLHRNYPPDIRAEQPDYVASIEHHDPAFATKWTKFLALRAKALAQPWTLADGGGADLQRGDRLYFVDSYGKWVSCLAEKRRTDSLSRYMFSTPGEWFAEAYAAFYSPDDKTRNQVSREVRVWFGYQLGLPTNKRSEEGDRWGDTPGLATGGDNSVLQQIKATTRDLTSAI